MDSFLIQLTKNIVYQKIVKITTLDLRIVKNANKDLFKSTIYVFWGTAMFTTANMFVKNVYKDSV